MQKTLIALTLTIFSVSALQADSAGGLNWDAPEGWQSQTRPMRAANYVIPPASGDSEPGECAVYYFGRGQGGGVEANVQRWVGQFQTASGGSAGAAAKRSSKTINGIKVTIVDVAGTYLFKPAPMSPRTVPKPDYRMLAAIAEGPDAPIFFKLTAPKKTADSVEAKFNTMLGTLKK